MAETTPVTFSALLRGLRIDSHLSQEELAGAATVSRRAVSDLERGIATTPQKETVRLLADALHLIGPERAQFEAVARGRQLPDVPEVAAAKRSLPRDVAAFTGRQRELEQLAAAALGAGGVASIYAIGGMAGVGKTAFAVHAGHQLAGMFPGGQIFVLLHGHTPGRRPVAPADALAGLLLTAGIPPAQIPPGLEARMALWRDRATGKRLLLVLDDATSSEQVRPLLPGDGGSLVLVTSRRHLSALDDARAISLDTLPAAEAAQLLVSLSDRPGLSPADPAVTEISRLCGYLPLAIGMVARQLRHHPAWSAAGRAAQLASARGRLELLATENLSVAAAFDLSYADLTGDQQRLFRRLGLHPGADIDAYAAAALDAADVSTALPGLEALYDQYLLTEPVQGRYRLHDLIREHAGGRADSLDRQRDREAATARLLGYYQHTAAQANALILAQTRPGPARAAATVAAMPALADQEQALAWARAERANLLACLDYAAHIGEHSAVVALTAGIAGLLRRDGPWAEAITRHGSAVAAAQLLGDRLGEANALIDLGDIQRLTGDHPAAAQTLERALGIYYDLGNQLGWANALHHLGILRIFSGDYAGAAQAQEQALRTYRDLGDRHGEASALKELGAVRWVTNDYQAAAQALQHAMSMYRELGDRRGQANVLDHLGSVEFLTGDYVAATQTREQGLRICRDLGDRLGEANFLDRLGALRRVTGDYSAAAEAYERALAIHRELGHPLGEANTLQHLAIVQRITGDHLTAAQALNEALATFRYLGNRLSEADALRELGALRRLTGDYAAAAQILEQALAILRGLGQRGGEGLALDERGALHRVTGELELAQRCHERALELARAIGSRYQEAAARAGLGRVALAGGDAIQAESQLRQALEIFRQLGAADALEIQAELDSLVASPALGRRNSVS